MKTIEDIMLTPCRALAAIATAPVLVVLIVMYAFFVLYVFPNAENGSGVGPLDLKFSYSADTAYEMIEAYGQQGRDRYVRTAVTVDLAYPIVYTLLLMVWISLSLREAAISPVRTCIAVMVPGVTFLLDLIENAGIVIMLRAFPQRHETLANMTSLATSAKWLAAGVAVLVAITSTAFAVRRRIVE